MKRKQSPAARANKNQILTADGKPIAIECDYTRLAKLDSLKLFPENPNTHSKAQIETYQAILLGLGIRRPAIRSKRSGFITCGNGAVIAARALGCTHWPIDDQSYPSEAEERAHVLADNQLPRLSDLDMTKVATMMQGMGDSLALTLTGFAKDEIADLLAGTHSSIAQTMKGSLLQLMKVCIDDPKTKVEKGDKFQVGRHIVLCTDVFDTHGQWAPLLNADTLFVPFGGPLILLTEEAKKRPFLVINPDPYLVGHILDKVIESGGTFVRAKD